MNQIDTTSRTWKVIEHYLNDRLAKCREKNDSPALSEADTAATRGEIAAIKNLLKLPSQLVQVQVDDPGYGADSIDG